MSVGPPRRLSGFSPPTRSSKPDQPSWKTHPWCKASWFEWVSFSGWLALWLTSHSFHSLLPKRTGIYWNDFSVSKLVSIVTLWGFVFKKKGGLKYAVKADWEISKVPHLCLSLDLVFRLTYCDFQAVLLPALLHIPIARFHFDPPFDPPPTTPGTYKWNKRCNCNDS